MLPTLTLSLNRSWTRSWSNTNTITDSNSGMLISRSGTKIEEGFLMEWKNGWARITPFHRVVTLTRTGDVILKGREARDARKRFAKNSKDYANNGWGKIKRALMRVLTPPCELLSALITTITLPIYVLLYVLWVIIALFWIAALKISAYALKKAL